MGGRLLGNRLLENWLVSSNDGLADPGSPRPGANAHPGAWLTRANQDFVLVARQIGGLPAHPNKPGAQRGAWDGGGPKARAGPPSGAYRAGRGWDPAGH